MKKYWWMILIGVIVALILIPLGIAFMLSFRVIETDTTNEWIGFWGGYLGSILGGVITLIVMNHTLKRDKENLMLERKTQFNDDLLKQLVEFQTAMESSCKYLSSLTKQESSEYAKINIDEEFSKMIILSKLISIKLESKKVDPKYKRVHELLESITNAVRAMRKVLGIEITEENASEFFEVLIDSIQNWENQIEELAKEILQYYAENEG